MFQDTILNGLEVGVASLRDRFLAAWQENEQRLQGLPRAGSQLARGFTSAFTAGPWMLGEGIAKASELPLDLFLASEESKTNQLLQDYLTQQVQRKAASQAPFEAFEEINEAKSQLTRRQQEIWDNIKSKAGTAAKQVGLGVPQTYLQVMGAGVSPKVLGITGAFGAGGAALQGRNIPEAFGRGAASGFKIAGLNQLTEPFISPVVERATELAPGALTKPLAKAAALGLTNVAEDELYSRFSEGFAPTWIDRLTSLGMGAAVSPFYQADIPADSMISRKIYQALGGSPDRFMDYGFEQMAAPRMVTPQAGAPEPYQPIIPVIQADQPAPPTSPQMFSPYHVVDPRAQFGRPVPQADMGAPTNVREWELSQPQAGFIDFGAIGRALGFGGDDAMPANTSRYFELKNLADQYRSVGDDIPLWLEQEMDSLIGTRADPLASQRGFARLGPSDEVTNLPKDFKPVNIDDPQTGKPYRNIEFRGVGKNPGTAVYGRGLYSTSDPSEAMDYGDLKKVMVDLENPFVVESPEDYKQVMGGESAAKALRAKGHDGIIIKLKGKPILTLQYKQRALNQPKIAQAPKGDIDKLVEEGFEKYHYLNPATDYVAKKLGMKVSPELKSKVFEIRQRLTEGTSLLDDVIKVE